MLVRCGPEYACVTAGAPTSAELQQGRKDKVMGPGARARRAGLGLSRTHSTLLKQVGVVSAVVQQPLSRVPHIAVKAEVDIGISSCTFEFAGAHSHTVPGHCWGVKATQWLTAPCCPHWPCGSCL